MYLKNLTLTNFKNYGEGKISFSKRINCIVGNNGVGKTNILDAIHYLSLTKSFFNSVDGVNIKHGEDFFILSGVFDSDGEEETITCSFQRQKQKIFKRNSKEYKRLLEHVGRVPVVMMSPADSVLISAGSEERRKFMNKIISQFDTVYLDSVMKYNKALLQRNRLLKEFKVYNHFDADALSIWNLQLERYGNYIYQERKKLVEEMIPHFRKFYSIISENKEDVRLSYRSHLDDGDFLTLLDGSLQKDRLLEYTSCGLHKDDLIFEMDGYPIKMLGSQGQQKSYLTALKLAKYEYIRQKRGVAPILLLDDVFDKFDRNRVEQIIHIVINEEFGQIFITDTNSNRLEEIIKSQNVEYKLFNIEEDNIVCSL